MNIAVLGGCFDPPHAWHYWTAQQTLELVSNIDQVWFAPDYTNAFKQVFASSVDRISMLRFLETPRIKVSEIATSKATTTYTIQVVQELISDTKNKYYWIVGSDSLNEFTRWRDYQKLSRMIQFLVFPRKDYPIRSLPPGFSKIEGNLLLSNISSSLIRERIKTNKPIKGLVLAEVEEYIKKRNLYK